MDDAETIRREFAVGWARTGEAWGIPRSTALVQGYFLTHGGPLTEAELRDALGLSHRAAFGALAECERWGLVEASAPQRSGARGPAGRAWVVVGDHWAWFRRVAVSRLERETGPILPLVAASRDRAREMGDPILLARLDGLAAFAADFDRAAGGVVGADPVAIGRLAGVLARLDEGAVARLLASIAEVPPDELAAAASRVASMRPAVLRRLLGLAARPGVAKLLDRLG